MSISCIAIDDDPNSLEGLEAYIRKQPNLELLNSFTDPLTALKEISKPVDIIFMDIEMPGISGIELATLLRKKTRFLIFTTAHQQYAIDAFGVEADDYLLKPYSDARFNKAIHNLYPGFPADKSRLPVFDDDAFFVPSLEDNEQLHKIRVDDLVAIEENGDRVLFKTVENTFPAIKLKLTAIVKMLQIHPLFTPVNNHVSISKQHIKSIFNDYVILSGGISYKISGIYKDALHHLFDTPRQFPFNNLSSLH